MGACVGLALGSALNHYMLNLFGPPLIAEFGWQKSQFALVGSLSLVSLFAVPIAGRFVDRFGARKSAMVGFTAVPAAFIAFSMMSGNIYEFYLIMVLKNILGILTTTIVFCRVIVERFDVARGLALSVLMSGAPLVGAIAVPLVGEVIDTHGWRTGYHTLAFLSAMGGFVAITCMGKHKGHVNKDADQGISPASASPPPEFTRDTFFTLVRQPVFLLLVIGMLLVNLPQVIVSSQLKLVLYESGAASRFATLLVSLYAVSVVIGRFISGFALDRIQPHKVALCTLGLPAVGFIILATSFDASWLLVGAVALVGLAQGAEGDIGAFLTSRKFSMQNYSFVYSFLIAAIGGGAAIGSLLLSYSLHLTDQFNVFLIISAVSTVLGALLFYLTGRFKSEPDAAESQADAVAAKAHTDS